MKKFSLILLISLLSLSVSAGNNDKISSGKKSVTGKVISLNGEEIPAAKITIKETNEIFYADMEGNFNFQIAGDKIYSISIETIGYEPMELKSNILGLASEISLKELH